MNNRIFEKTPVNIPNKSGCDLSHENCGTGLPGALIPVFTREMLGNESLSVNLGEQIQFPAFATDFYGRIKVFFEAFFVPYRLINGAYKQMYKMIQPSSANNTNVLHTYAEPQLGSDQVGPATPGTYSAPGLATYKPNPHWPGLLVDDTVPFTSSDSIQAGAYPLDKGGLLDYLGVKVNRNHAPIGSGGGRVWKLHLENFNRLLAYHVIFQDYYRDARLEAEPFQIPNATIPPIWGLPYARIGGTTKEVYNDTSPLADGWRITALRSRPYAKDYFTVATTSPQFGNEMAAAVENNNPSTNRPVVSISQIRAANSLQQYTEIHNRVGNHYDDLAFALTGIRPSDAASDIPIFLGRIVEDVYVKSIYDTTNSYTPGGSSPSSNPFTSPATKFGNAQSVGSGHLFDFTATEGGICMILMSVVPEARYGSGTHRSWAYDSLFDQPIPHLAGLGDQPIYTFELLDSYSSISVGGFDEGKLDLSTIFGYSQRFAEAKFMLDEVHGQLCTGEVLSSFALKREFSRDDNPNIQIGSDFLRISPSALSEVMTYDPVLQNVPNPESPDPDDPEYQYPFFGFWYDLFFDTKLVTILPAYSIPTLENFNGRTVEVDNGGRRL